MPENGMSDAVNVRLGEHSVLVQPDTHPAQEDYWQRVDSGAWEPGTLGIICERLGKGSKFIDVGAWIGPTTLAAAAAGASVLAYEPDPVALDGLRLNLGLNPQLLERVTIRPCALAERDGTAIIRSSRLGNSGSSLMYNEGEDQAVVPVVDALREVREETWCTADLIKVDIEGAEYGLVRQIAGELRVGRPALLLSTHFTFVGQNVVRYPRAVRGIAGRWLHARHIARLLWDLRFYRSLEVIAEDGTRRRLGKVRLFGTLALPRNREVFLS